MALILGYSSDLDLSRHVDAFINKEATQFQERNREINAPRTEDGRRLEPLQFFATSERGQIVPRVETIKRTVKDPCSATRTVPKSFRVMVLSNQTGWEARNVRFRFTVEEGVIFDDYAEYPPVPVMAPGAEFRFDLNLRNATTDLAQCVVTWDDNDGNHTAEVTVQA